MTYAGNMFGLVLDTVIPARIEVLQDKFSSLLAAKVFNSKSSYYNTESVCSTFTVFSPSVDFKPEFSFHSPET